MKPMELERQRWNEYRARKEREAAQAVHQQLLDAQMASVSKQHVFSQDIVDQLMSKSGYQGYRLQLDVLDDKTEWEVQEYTEGWGWNCIDNLGFKQGQVTVYKTVGGALRRIKKELEQRR